jgi:hypothetical protein
VSRLARDPQVEALVGAYRADLEAAGQFAIARLVPQRLSPAWLQGDRDLVKRGRKERRRVRRAAPPGTVDFPARRARLLHSTSANRSRDLAQEQKLTSPRGHYCRSRSPAVHQLNRPTSTEARRTRRVPRNPDVTAKQERRPERWHPCRSPQTRISALGPEPVSTAGSSQPEAPVANRLHASCKRAERRLGAGACATDLAANRPPGRRDRCRRRGAAPAADRCCAMVGVVAGCREPHPCCPTPAARARGSDVGTVPGSCRGEQHARRPLDATAVLTAAADAASAGLSRAGQSRGEWSQDGEDSVRAIRAFRDRRRRRRDTPPVARAGVRPPCAAVRSTRLRAGGRECPLALEAEADGL